MKFLVIVPIIFLISCTTPNVRDTSLIDQQSQNCETVDCVIDLMDTLPQGPDKDRFPFMEGFRDPNLKNLKDAGKLTVEIMNPLFLSLLVFGYANFESYPYGGMNTCDVRYVPGLNWTILKHELSHCQGYADNGIPLMPVGYTDKQIEIMKKENVSKWIDTQFHKSNQDFHLNQ